MKDPDSPLRELLSDPDVVLFVGSGISLWSGLPTWPRLISALISKAARSGYNTNFAERELARGDLLTSADAIVSQISRNDLAATLRDDLGFSRARPHRIHALLTGLGVNRFVTTNYDKLLEQQLGLENRLGEFQITTNHNISGIADIQKARADRFIFKPHGDIDLPDSIVIGRSDYEHIIRQRSSQILRALETIFVSRPILFIGYGQRDPDLQLLLSSLRDTYFGSAGRLLSIMPDIDPEEARYLNARYGLQIWAYQTRDGAISSERDHTPLLELLERLVKWHATTPSTDRAAAETTLFGFARYGARLAQNRSDSDVEVRATIDPFDHRVADPTLARSFHHAPLRKILSECSGSFIITGPAGSGKSFALRRFIAERGLALRDWALAEQPSNCVTELPVFLDSRLYDGNFAQLATMSLPTELSLGKIPADQAVVFVVDSIDEMPRHFLDLGTWERDLRELVSPFPNRRIIYGARRSDLVAARDVLVFDLLPLENDDVIAEFTSLGIDVQNFTTELLRLLSNPFALRIGRQILRSHFGVQSPSDLFQTFVESALIEALGTKDAGILRALQGIAFTANVRGIDTFFLSDVESVLDLSGSSANLGGAQIVNELVRVGLLISEVEQRVRFVHRSILEYLAGLELVGRRRSGNLVLYDILTSRRWDNALAWCAHLLSETELTNLIEEICSVDIILALRITRSVEVGRDQLLNEVLDVLHSRLTAEMDLMTSFSLADELEDTRFAPTNIPALTRIAEGSSAIAGVAAAALIECAPTSQLRKWMEKMCAGRISYNAGSHIASALAQAVDDESFKLFLSLFAGADFNVRTDGSTPDAQFVISRFVSELPSNRRSVLLRWARAQSQDVRSTVCSALSEGADEEEIAFLVEQWEQGVEGAEFSLYLNLRWGGNFAVPECTDARIDLLVRNLRRPFEENSEWGVKLGRTLCCQDETWSASMARRANQSRGFEAAILGLMSPQTRTAAVNQALRELFRTSTSSLKAGLIIESFESQDIREHWNLIFDWLCKTEADNAVRMFQNMAGASAGFETKIQIRPEEIDELVRVFVAGHGSYVKSWLAQFIVSQASEKGIDHVVDRAQSPSDPQRDYILTFVIPRIPAFSVRALNEETWRALLNAYVRYDDDRLGFSPGRIATEEYISQVVLPFAAAHSGEPDVRRAVDVILREAGQKHGRRYIAPW